MTKIEQRSQDLPKLLLKQVVYEGEISRAFALHFIFLILLIPLCHFLFNQSYIFIAIFITFITHITYYYISNSLTTKINKDQDYLTNKLYPLLVNYQLYLYLKKEKEDD